MNAVSRRVRLSHFSLLPSTLANLEAIARRFDMGDEVTTRLRIVHAFSQNIVFASIRPTIKGLLENQDNVVDHRMLSTIVLETDSRLDLEVSPGCDITHEHSAFWIELQVLFRSPQFQPGDGSPVPLSPIESLAKAIVNIRAAEDDGDCNTIAEKADDELQEELTLRTVFGFFLVRRKLYSLAERILNACVTALMHQNISLRSALLIAATELVNCRNRLGRARLGFELAESILSQDLAPFLYGHEVSCLRIALADSLVGQGIFEEAITTLKDLTEAKFSESWLVIMSALRLSKIGRRQGCHNEALSRSGFLWKALDLLDVSTAFLGTYCADECLVSASVPADDDDVQTQMKKKDILNLCTEKISVCSSQMEYSRIMSDLNKMRNDSPHYTEVFLEDHARVRVPMSVDNTATAFVTHPHSPTFVPSSPIGMNIEGRPSVLVKPVRPGSVRLAQSIGYKAPELNEVSSTSQTVHAPVKVHFRDVLGLYPLHEAVDRDSVPAVRLLLRVLPIDSRNARRETVLYNASSRGHEGMVKLLLDKGAAVDVNCESGETALHAAVRWGHDAIVILLLMAGADLESKSHTGETPLWLAVLSGRESAVQLLLDNGAKVDSRDYIHQTPLSFAVLRGYKGIARLLLDKGAEVDSRDYEHQTPLSLAVSQGHESMARLLLDNGAEPDLMDNHGDTPLAHALMRNKEAVGRLLIDAGATVHRKNKDAQPLLVIAVMHASENMVKLILDRGADMNAWSTDEYYNALNMAVARGSEPVVRLLLDRGANLEAVGSDGRTPLSWAAECGHEAMVRLLLDKGVPPDQRDASGRTPLAWAAQRANRAIVAMLLEKGADVDAQDKGGRTPIMWAVTNGHTALTKLLLEKGADIDAQDLAGRTPLSYGVQSFDAERIAKLLLSEGADPNLKDKNGKKPQSRATRSSGLEVVALLISYGATP
ncbi:hypothetical protein B0A49_10458 [Cryomyces minteri]|uniref:Uncharacterized protein n=1 Tax=Cryomyces minteri TaxID=331657 RepID=A0A4U0WJA8_9PEZI|nr:hypothetical protein B0A49_10458 [Cryomyces minteri]